MNFKVNVNSEIELDISSENLSNLDTVKTSEMSSHVLFNNRSYKAKIVKSDFSNKSYDVMINNKSYTIKISNRLDYLIKDLGFSIGSSKHIDLIKAPMPGLILEINVEVGQTVKEDDPLLILEAMKMENVLTSPRNGIIKTISVEKGNAVEKNALLIEFE
jgi:biotin carboxyl carrier protein